MELPRRSEKKTSAAFTLIELSIVVVIIAVILTVSVPLLLRQRINANETSAISSLRSISTSEQAFIGSALRDDNSDNTADYGTWGELLVPPGGSVTPFIVAFNDLPGNANVKVKAGYEFRITVFPGDGILEPRFSIFGFPQVYNKTGVRNFYIDQELVIRFNRGSSGQGSIGPNSPPVN